MNDLWRGLVSAVRGIDREAQRNPGLICAMAIVVIAVAWLVA